MKIALIILTFLLLVSNAFWIYQTIDAGVTITYRTQQLYQLEETRKQLMAVMPEIADGMPREEVVAAAEQYTDQTSYEKDGCTWVGWLGLKFDQSGNLQSVSPSWNYGAEDPCFPAF